MILFVAFYACMLTVNLCAAETDDIDCQAKLREVLLANYEDKRTRPVNDESTTVQVQIRYLSIMEFELDTKSGMFTLNLGMLIKWTDEFVTWDSSFCPINDTIFGYEELWKPNIVIFDGGYGSAVTNSFDKQRFRVSMNGQVTWEPRAIIKTRCHVDLTDYPYDTQKCAVMITDVDDAKEVNITTMGRKRLYCPSYRSTKWNCINGSIIVEHENHEDYAYSLIQVIVILKRKESFYRFVIVYPYVAATISAICMLLVPLSSKLRYLFAFWALIIFIFQLTFVGFELGIGTYGDPPYIVRCLGMNIISVSCLLILSTLIHPLINSEETLSAPPDFLVTIIGSSVSRLVLRLNSGTIPITSSETSSHSSKQKVILGDWLLIASFIDRICLFAYIVLIIVYHS